MPAHHHEAEKMIDGAVNPEKIPDVVAYRFYLLTIAKSPNVNATDSNAAANETVRLASHRNMIGLQTSDLQNLAIMADNFGYQYHHLISSYNQVATENWKKGERTDIRPLLLQRDELVQSTVKLLKNSLTADGWSRLNAHVQGEKIHMKISAQEAGQ